MHTFGNPIRLVLTLAICFSLSHVHAQTNAAQQARTAAQTSAPQTYSGTVTGLSLKNAKQPEPMKTRAEDIVWKRDVYRIVDLSLSENASLYYPVEATAERKNLFSAIFEAIAQNQVKAYEYLDGRELFTEAYVIKFRDLLKRFDIPFKEKTDPRRPNTPIFDIDAIDIPTSEVLLYYVKEVVYLDQRNSNIQTRTVALCPVLVRSDDYEGTRRFPMFWVPIEALKDYLSGQAVAADSLNSVERITMYDYFNLRRYKGEIYKVSNLKNQSIYDYCKTPEEIKAEQERLEKSLQGLGDSLWEPDEKTLKEARDKEEQARRNENRKKPVENAPMGDKK
ncbi:MAG: gliding motility protein GldN [Bacteroidales bacterium]|nr:gliding motility protein GldN [Bacteroidales bacterium]